MLKRTTIDAVNDLPIDLVIGKFVDLKRSGGGYEARSPFTDEKTASFKVSPSKGVWKCFSSGRGGGSGISFVMAKEDISFIEAVKMIADQHGIIIEMDDSEESRKYLERSERARSIHEINALALQYFIEKIDKTPKKDRLRANPEMEKKFALGYATAENDGLMKTLQGHGISNEQMFAAGLITEAKEDAPARDFFRNRVMFPVMSYNGRILGFSGRYCGTSDKPPKYLNTRTTEAYSKSNAILGLYQSKNDIAKKKEAAVVEGNYDVTSLHSQGLLWTVAPCGAFTKEHAVQISRSAKLATLFIDNDQHGIDHIEKNTILLLEESVNVMLFIPEESGQDPDDLVRSKKWAPGEFLGDILDQRKEAIQFLADKYYQDTNTVFQRSEAINKLTNLLSKVGDPLTRNNYVKHFSSKTYSIEKAQVEKLVSVSLLVQNESANDTGFALPSYIKGDDLDAFKNYGFYEDTHHDKIGYYFPTANSSIRMTNFLVEPLFQLKTGQNDSKRIMKLVNSKTMRGNREVLIEITNKGFVSPQAFEEAVQNQGEFWFAGTRKEFIRLKMKLLGMFPFFYEVQRLGWQRRGFFAFADGIIENGRFKRVDSFGGVLHGDDNYFLPAFSKLYEDAEDDDDLYEADRTFVYRPGNVTCAKWFDKMGKVHGVNGMWTAIYLLPVLFRDFIFEKLQFFPHIGMFGPIQTGKSTCARSLNSIFYYNQTPFLLATGTKISFSRRLSRYRNVTVWMDEYTNEIENDRFQAIKGAYDGSGHEKAIMSQDTRTKTTKVNGAILYSGQYFPTRDDNSLNSRTILLSFETKAGERTPEEIKEFEELRKYEQNGLSNIIIEIIRYRDYLVSEFVDQLSDMSSELKSITGSTQIEGRVFNNYSILVTCYSMLADKLKLPWKLEEVIASAAKMITKQSEMIQDSNALNRFWKVMEFMSTQLIIKEHRDYVVKEMNQVTLRHGRSKSETIQLEPGTDVLILRFNQIYPLYLKCMKDQFSEQGIDEPSLRYYMESSKAFIGKTSAARFEETNTSGIMFRYAETGGALRLESEKIKHKQNQLLSMTDDTKNSDDLPF